MRALRSLTLLFALAGAPAAHAEAKKPTPLSAEHAQKLLAFVGELTDTAVKHAGNCPTLATELDGFVTRNLDTVHLLWDVKRQKQIVPQDVQAKLDQRGVELVGALRACWNDERVKAAFQRLKLPKDEKK